MPKINPPFLDPTSPVEMINRRRSETKETIHWIFFFTLGLSVLFVWNSILSLTVYFQQKIDPSVASYYPFFFSFGGFCYFAADSRLLVTIPLKHLIMTIPCLQVAVFLSIYLVSELVNDGQPASNKKVIFLMLIYLAGVFNNCLQTNAIRYVFRFTHVEISLYDGGTAVAGCLSNVIGLVVAFALSPSETSKSGLYYIIALLITLGIILAIFLRYFKSGSAAGLHEYQTYHELKESDKHKEYLLDTLKIISPFFFNMILIYSITLSIFPAFNFAMGLGTTHPAAFQLILLSFNAFDVLGKIIYAKFPLKDNATPQIVSLSRVLFWVFTLYTFGGREVDSRFVNKPAVTLLFASLLAVTNGYLTSTMFSLAAERVTAKHSSNSGILMTVALMVGLSFGSFTILVGKK